MVTLLHPLSTLQDSSTHHCTIAVSTIASSSIRHSPHRSRRTLTPFSGIHLPVDLRGQVYSLARSISTHLNHCRGSSSSFYPWVDSRFGAPSQIVTDRGRQFESGLWKALTTLLGVKRTCTTAYHPQSNGMVERLHRQLKAALKAHGNTSWMDSLPLVLLGIRTAVKEDIQCTAAEMVYGATLRLPGELITPSRPVSVNTSDFVTQLKTRMQQALPKPPRPVNRTSHVSDDLNTCTHVFIRHDAVRKPLQPPYDGPYAVLKRNNKHFTININGRTDTVSLDRLKPAYVDIDVASTPIPTHLQSLNHPVGRLRLHLLHNLLLLLRSQE